MGNEEKEIRVWTHAPEAVAAAILEGKETEDTTTQYGVNEFAVDFLKQNGIWEELLVKPKQGKNNGKDWRKLAGIAILSELLHVGQLAKADKVLKDAKLMRELGFTFEETEVAENNGKGVLHRDTMRNYFKNIGKGKSMREFYAFVDFMRQKRWIRGKTYVADGFEVEVFGKTYKGKIGRASCRERV